MKNLIAILFAFGLAAQTPPMIPMATGGGPVGGATNLTTVGSVPYVSASGTLDQDAGQFFWDATNNRLGIGTTTPSSSLTVGANNFTVDTLGRTSIAGYSTGTQLSIGGDPTALLGDVTIMRQGRDTDTGSNYIQSFGNNTANGRKLHLGGYSGSFNPANGVVLTVDPANSRVGIGTTTPVSALDVSSAPLTTFTNNPITTTLISTTAYAANMGAGIQFQGKWNSAGQSTTIAYIGGVKENSTDGNYDGKLVFGTRQNGLGANDMTRMTILASGNVGIGTSPGYKLEVLGSSNAEIARVGDGTRSFGISTYTPNSGGVTLRNSGTGLISLTVANAVLIGTSYAGLGSGVSANTVAIEGNVGIGTTGPTFKLDVATSGASGTFRAYDATALTGSTLAVFRAGVLQSGNVLEVQNNAGANVLGISATGGLSSAVSITAGGNVNAGVTQDLGWSTRSTMTSPASGVIALYNNAQTDFNRLQFGGTTSSFPSIQRSTTKLFFRLADDSAGATVRAGGYESSDGTAGATVTTCTGFKNGLCISGT